MNRKRIFEVIIVVVAAVMAAIALFAIVNGAAAGVGEYPYPAEEPTGAVQINEVSWAGTNASSSDEWFELTIFNMEVNSVNLDGWTVVLTKTGGVTSTIDLPPVIITAGEYALFERTDDNAVASVTAAGTYAGSLSNTGVVELALHYPNGELSHRIVMTEANKWPAGTSNPRASMQLVQHPVTFTPVWMTSNQGSEIDNGGSVILGTPGSANIPPVSNPETCGQLPDAWTRNLELVLFEDLSTQGQVIVTADLWGVDDNNSLVATEGVGTVAWVGTNWQVGDVSWDVETSTACIDALELLIDEAENLLNGKSPSVGLPLEFETWLGGVVAFQTSGMTTINLPLVVNE